MQQKMVVAQTDCPARKVPSGEKTVIPTGSFVTINQALGGNYTVTHQGNMLRVDGTDAQALGLESEQIQFAPMPDGKVHKSQIEQALQTIFDPEIPINLLDLGLIYGIDIEQSKVTVRMTLTSPTCGMAAVLVSDVQYRVAKVPNVEQVNVELVFDPPWHKDMMSEAAQLEAGLFF